ncbi:hypothetical protein KFE98_10795 [bacterium SCSIO 12741]|nr:hypothetical protein KFE98_10795 [bacterium SCSIO 12741]
MKKFTLGVFLLSALSTSTFAHVGPDDATRGGKKPNSSLAANCAPSAYSTELDINNTRAVIQTGGDMWWDFTNAQYEIPKNSGHTALFAGALWLGDVISPVSLKWLLSVSVVRGLTSGRVH